MVLLAAGIVEFEIDGAWLASNAYGQPNQNSLANSWVDAESLLNRCATVPHGHSRVVVIPTTPVPKSRVSIGTPQFNPHLRNGSFLHDRESFTLYVVANNAHEIMRALELGQVKVFTSPYRVMAADPNDHSVLFDVNGQGLLTFDAKLGPRESMRVAFRGGIDISSRVLWNEQPAWPIPPSGAGYCSVWALLIVSKYE